MTTVNSYNNAPKGPVTILGDAYVGETLIARPNGIGDADGIDYNTASFQWLRDGKAITGATSQKYTVTLADAGTNISIRYSYTDLGGTREVLTSDPEPTVPAAGTPIPDDTARYSPLIILGDAVVGESVIARPNAITDNNGIDHSSASFQWLRDGQYIPGATSQKYEVAEADIGAAISVRYSYRDLLGTKKSLTSNPKPEVPSPDGDGTAPNVPSDDRGVEDTPKADEDSNPLVILGDAVVGESVIARPNAITDNNGIDHSSASFQWLRDGQYIPGATSQKYEVTEADIGAVISIQYSYRDLLGVWKSLRSDPKPEVPSLDGDGTAPNVPSDDRGVEDTPKADEDSNPLVILGDAVVGESVIARPNAITDNNGIDHSSASFQWLRDGQYIPGATSQKYEVTEADIGAVISIQYSYRDLLGVWKSLRSDPKPEVPSLDGDGTAPNVPSDDRGVEDTPKADEDSNPLVILGDAVVGESVIARPNAITDNNGIDHSSASFQWLRDGQYIPGATSQKYEVTEADIGAVISIQYSYRDLLGVWKSLRSDPKPEVPSLGDTGAAPRVSSDDGGAEDAPQADEDSVPEGTTGSDTFTARAGNDVIDGMGGADTLSLSGDQSQYTLTLSSENLILTDRMAGGTGTDTLISIERLDFQSGVPSAGGGALNMDTLDGITTLSPSELAPIIELYIAYFNRAPDAVGLAFWGNSFAEGVGMAEMAAMFMDQNETRAAYPDTMSNAEFLTAIYNNVLGRDPDAEGFAFWLDHLDAGRLGRDTFILDVLGGAKAEPGPDAAASHIANLARDKQYLTDKTDIGAYFSVHKGMSDLTDAAQAMALFDGSQGSLQDAVEAIDAHYAEALDPSAGDFLMPLVGVLDAPFMV